MRGEKKIDKASNKFLQDTVLTSSEKVQAPGKGVNDAVEKGSKQMRGDINNSSLESGSLDAVLIASTEVHAPEKGVNNAGPKSLVAVKAPVKGS